MRVQVLQGRYTVVRLEPDARIPDWVGGAFFSTTRTPAELSIVVEEPRLPAARMDVESGWRVLSVAGPIDFSEIGVLLGLAAPLAEAGVSIFTLSTYETDHLLVREAELAVAVAALRDAGHEVIESGPEA